VNGAPGNWPLAGAFGTKEAQAMLLRTATLAVAGLALLAPPQAQANDAIFGSFFSRIATPASASARGGNPEAAERERQSREMRRAYWEREQRRLSRTTVADDRTEIAAVR
jgi:hypothetical protein